MLILPTELEGILPVCVSRSTLINLLLNPFFWEDSSRASSIKVLGLLFSNAEELDITEMSVHSLSMRIVRVYRRNIAVQILRNRAGLLHHLRLKKSLAAKKISMGIG